MTTQPAIGRVRITSVWIACAIAASIIWSSMRIYSTHRERVCVGTIETSICALDGRALACLRSPSEGRDGWRRQSLTQTQPLQARMQWFGGMTLMVALAV